MTYDVAAIYIRYRDLMHRVAYAQLQGTGREADAEDVVSEVVIGLLNAPPGDVQNWEAFVVTAVKRRAIDRLRSASVRHSGGALNDEHSQMSDGCDFAEDVVDGLARVQRAAVVRDSMAVLEDRERKVVWEVAALERLRSEVAAELGVTPARITQIKNLGLKRLEDEMRRRETGDG